MKIKRDTQPGVPEFLLWGSIIADGIVLQKDGSLLAGFRIIGPDTISTPDHERDSMVDRANRALRGLGSGWTMWFDVLRERIAEYPATEEMAFPDPVSRMVDAERREQFLSLPLYRSRHVVMFGFTPADQRSRKAGEMMLGASDNLTPQDKMLRDFERRLLELESAFSGIARVSRLRGYDVRDTRARPLLRDALVDHLDTALTGETHGLNLPPDGAYLDGVIGGLDLDPTGEYLRLGDQYVSVVSIDGYPEASFAGILDRLDLLPLTYRWSTRFIFTDRHEVEGELHKLESRWRQRVKGFVSQVLKTEGRDNADAVEMADQTRAAISESSSEQVAYGYHTSTVVLRADNEETLTENSMSVKKAVTSAGFAARIEEMNALDAFFGTLAGHSLPNVRRPMVSTRHLADFLPLADLWTGPERCDNPFYPANSPVLLHTISGGDTPFRVNLHVGDLGHTLIFGPSSAGKTTLVNTIALSALRYPDMRIWSFDYKRGMLATTKAVGGLHYDIGSEAGPWFCPLGILDTDEDAAWAEGWLATCFELQTDRQPTPRQTAEIHRAVNLLRTSPHRTLSDFLSIVQDESVRSALHYYSITGTTGRLLDVSDDGLEDDSFFTTFETEDFMAYPEKARLPVMLYLFRRFERSLDGRPALLLLLECWSVLSHPVFVRQLGMWLRTLRSKNAAVVMETQSVADIAEGKLTALLRESCPTKIFLPNAEAEGHGTDTQPGPRDYYQMLGRNDDDIRIIATARPKADYYITQPDGKRLVHLALGPKALAFAGATSKVAAARVNQLVHQYGKEWPAMWLAEQGVEV